jgi:hypothetical protein
MRATTFIWIRGLHKKLWAPKVTRVPTLGILGVPGQNDIWVLVLWPGTEYTIWGEGGGFPQVRAMVNLVSPWLPLAHSCTKVLQLRINQLVVWFVHVCVSKWLLINLPSPHPGAPTCPSTPKVLWAKERAQLLFLSLSTSLDLKSLHKRA